MAQITNKLETSLKQKLILTSKMRSSLEILKMSAFDIQSLLKKELAENPFLKIDKNYKTNSLPFDSHIKSATDVLEETLENRAESIFEHLLSQLRVMNIGQSDLILCERIISYIDKEGYIKTPISLIAKENGMSEKNAQRLLGIIKTLDPAGIASATLEENLITQIRFSKSEYKKNAIEIVENYLEKLSENRYKEIAENLGISLYDVENARKLISSLEPYPARDFSLAPQQYIIPEIFIYKIDEKWTVYTNESAIPRLQINKKYIKINKESLKNDELDYLKKEEEKAKNLIESVEDRAKTLYKTALALLHFQYDFFEHGKERIKPLSLKDVSEYLSLSQSTISRVVSKKYLQTERGVFSLKYFFSSSVEGVSSRAIKEMIKRIIMTSQLHLSDEKIKKILEAEGVRIARRTISKYRKELGVSLFR